jgi:hypothetical protein
MNYWPPTDGTLPPPFDNEDIGTSEVIADGCTMHRCQDAQPRRIPRARELRPTLRRRGSARSRCCRRRPRRRTHRQRIHRRHRL